ncbi:MAG: RsiV family protein [Treponema sp.]|jgi:hypothetical protein|nr:RsiV family protein [Treponema sp.]
MTSRKSYSLLFIFPCILLGSACTGMPSAKKQQYTPQYYSFSVLLDPETPETSPQLDLAMSLLRMEYPPEQAVFFNEAIYLGGSIDDYKDKVVREQRSNYRVSAQGNAPGNNWRRSETVNVTRSLSQGIIVEREVNFESGDGRDTQTKRYYVLDMEDRRQLKIDDFFANYQEQKRLRDIVYEEMRKFSKLERGKPLSGGIFFTDEPELSFNFFITDDGLGLHWDPQQIAPFSCGSIEIIVPWYSVRPMMLVSGMELLTKFDINIYAYKIEEA